MAINFSEQITLGSVLIAALVAVFAGIFTIRSNVARIWREDAEGQRTAKEQAQEELAQEKIARATFEKEQQEIRHELKDTIAGLKSQIKVMEAKTDLSIALDAISKIAIAQQDSFVETHKLLTEIRDKLPTGPLSVEQPVAVHVEELKQPVEVHEVGKEGGDDVHTRNN